jgi:hypothetical protein
MVGIKNIVVVQGCRSDEGLSLPIIRRLKEQDWCDVYNCKLEPMDYIASYQKVDYLCKAEKHIGNHNARKPDLVFITGDRVEMAAAAQAAFLNNVPICHYYAGVINTPQTTYDDYLRHQITLVSDIQFVESEDALGVVWDLKHSVGLKSNAHVVGISHLDDMEVDISKIPYQRVHEKVEDEERRKTGFYDYDVLIPYDLVLVNHEPLMDKQPVPYCKGEGKLVIQIGGNPDGDFYKLIPNDIYYDNLPRAQFLGLLKNCSRFITNSSAAIYEAPHFLKPEQIIQIGDRNRNRPPVACVPGASDKIVSILKTYLQGD